MLEIATLPLMALGRMPSPTQSPNWSTAVVEYVDSAYSRENWLPPTSIVVGNAVAPNEISLLDKLVGVLSSYVNLGDDWDGYDGVPPTRVAVDNALAFISKLPNNLVLPKPMLSGNGNIGLYWKTDTLYLDIEFEGDGSYSYYAEKDGSDHSLFDDLVSVTAELPEALAQILLPLNT